MDITFNKENDFYVATFEAAADFNLHIEKAQGIFRVYQSTVPNGEYDRVDNVGDQWDNGAIDLDFTALIYPKYIRLVSAVEPTKAVVTFGADVETAINEVIVSSLNNPV